MAEGTITKKDIITDDAINWGAEYAKIMDMAIGKNKEFADGILAINNANNLLRSSNSQKEYIENQKKVNEEANKTLIVWKEQTQLENALISTKKKNELATESTNRKLIEERLLLAQTNKLITQEIKDRLGLTTAYDKLSRARNDAKIKLRDLIISEGESSKAVKEATKEFEELDRKVRLADKAVGDFTKNVGNYPKLTTFTNGVKGLFAAFGLVGGIAAFASVMKGAINIIKEFDQSIADLQAITGASGKDLEYLKNQAILLGKATKGGATAVVEAYKLIASAKPELLENVQALNQVTEAVLILSKASGMEMPAAATALTDAMNQFGADASQASVFVDALANGAKFGAAEIPEVTEALLKFGAVARSSNISIQESTALIELLAENGLKGADAGTALRNVLLKLSAPDALPRRAKEEIEKLGISFETLKDKSIPIQARLEELKPLLKDNASIVKVFGLENATAAINVLAHTDRLKDLTSKMSEVGTAEEQAAIRANTLNGAFDRLESAWSSFVLSLSEKGNGLGTTLKWITNELTTTVEGWRKIFTTNEKLKEEELAKIRKEGFDSIVKSYSDKNKLNESQLNIIKKLNSEEIAENVKKVNALNAENKKLSQNTVFLTGAIKNDSFAKIMENRRKISELNKSSTNLLGKNEGIDSLVKSRQPAKTDPNSKNSSTETGPTEKEIKDALAIAKKLNDSLYELQKQKLERSIKINEEIAKDEEQTDDVRIAALEVSQKKQIALAELTKQHSLDYDKFVLEADKLNANQKTFIANEAANKIVDINKKTSEEIAKINEFDTKLYDDKIKREVSEIEIANNDKIAKEDKRFQDELALGYDSDKAKEDAAKNHERNLFNIKKQGLIAIANLQIDNLKNEIDAYEIKANEDGKITQKESDFILSKRKEVSDLSVKLIQAEGEKFKENEEDKAKTGVERLAQWYKENEKIINDIVDISTQSLDLLSQLSNNYSERKIDEIDQQIDKNNEYYDKQIELAGNDQRQKDLLQQEKEKKNAELEKKKRKEQEKQAKFEKAVAIAQIAIQTALSVVKASPAIPLMIMAGVAGAIALATAIATPIPKYKDGRKGGPAETAWVGDGFVNEVITSADGSNPILTPNKPTLTHLKKDDRVFKSVDDYNRYIRASILNGFRNENQKISDFQANQYGDKYSKEIVDELKRNTQAIKSQKFPANDTKQVDINHHLWKMGNTNWK